MYSIDGQRFALQTSWTPFLGLCWIEWRHQGCSLPWQTSNSLVDNCLFVGSTSEVIRIAGYVLEEKLAIANQ